MGVEPDAGIYRLEISAKVAINVLACCKDPWRFRDPDKYFRILKTDSQLS